MAVSGTKNLPRATAQNTFYRHPPATQQAITGDSLIGVFGACGDVTTGVSDKTGKRQLIEPDQACSNKSAGSAAPGPRIIATSPDRLFHAETGSD